MAQGHFARLDHRAVLAVNGEDSRSFLQGLISNDIAKAGAARALWAALLTPQGKFLHDLFVAERGDTLLLDAEAARIEDLRKKLSLYKLRAKVTLAPAPELTLWAAWGDGAAAAVGLAAEAGAAVEFGGGIAFVDPRLDAAGLRLMLPAETAAQTLAAIGLVEAPFAAWDEARILLGLPDGSRDLPVEKAILLENGFDELGGVDFKKGCYMGQELTSRTKHRGLVRKRLMPVLIDGPIPEPGTPVRLGDVDAGEMHSVAGGVGLAMIRLEHFRQAAGHANAFTAGSARLTVVPPAWAVFPAE